ncbi:MAG: hypothetical protein IKT40_12180 [Bacilli bacterium]|nr:hypothetical protein [Bacilli bacterium]
MKQDIIRFFQRLFKENHNIIKTEIKKNYIKCIEFIHFKSSLEMQDKIIDLLIKYAIITLSEILPENKEKLLYKASNHKYNHNIGILNLDFEAKYQIIKFIINSQIKRNNSLTQPIIITNIIDYAFWWSDDDDNDFSWGNAFDSFYSKFNSINMFK